MTHSLGGWAPLVAQLLRIRVERVSALAATESFSALGGTSLQAIALVALGQRRLALQADVGLLLAPRPLARALSAAIPCTESPPAAVSGAGCPPVRELLPGQRGMLAAHVNGNDQPYRLMFTLESPEPLMADRTRDALHALVIRHESLRTMFVPGGRVVLPPARRPRLLSQTLPGTDDAIRTIHDLYADRAGDMLRPFDEPPAVFVLTTAGQRTLLTAIVHHVLVDGWSIGVLWRDFADLYTRAARTAEPGPSPERIAMRLACARASGAYAAALARAVRRLEGAPAAATLSADLPPVTEADGRGARLVFHLTADAAAATETLARRCGITVTSVALAAWALTVTRRSGQDDLVLGVPAAGRPEAGMEGIAALCTRIVPVRCAAADGQTADGYLTAAAAALAEAVTDADVPFEDVVAARGPAHDPGHNALAQFGFAAHHELVPDTFATCAGPWRITEGHCRGSVFDALLYLQSWLTRPRLALEYATSVLSAADAGDLAESFQAVLERLAADPDAPVASVTSVSAEQSRRLARLGTGGAFDTAEDIWSRVAWHARSDPDAIAVIDIHRGIELTYAQLHRHALAQARLLRDLGASAGDRVIVEVPRSAAEAVAVLGIMCLGAAYVAVDPGASPQWRARIRDAVAPRVRIGADGAAWAGVTDCGMPDLDRTDGPRDLADPHVADPGSVAYVSFTSGSTGVPKGVAVPHRAVLRLAADPSLFAEPAGLRMLRLSPLAFDASALELLVPFANARTVVICPPGQPTPSAIAGTLAAGKVTHAWLTAGLFHLVADHRPDAFGGLRQLFTGGGVVSPAHVRRVLEHCPGLRVTNGYGPTENTVFTTVHHVDGAGRAPGSLPIGTPVLGTDLYIADARGRLVPPGAVGELLVGGAGLADGYIADPQRTADAFSVLPVAGQRVYRTGDLVRWGDDGALRFLGRNDRQVKIAGHRVELADIERRIRTQRGVQDAVVFLSGRDPLGMLLCAAVKPAVSEFDLTAVRCAVEAGSPAYAWPGRWAAIAEFPLDRNGKVDVPALDALVTADADAPPSAGGSSQADLEALVFGAWTEALGTDDFDIDEAFFDVGGDSLRLAMVRNLIQQRWDGREIPLTDLYRFPTVQSFARYLHADGGART